MRPLAMDMPREKSWERWLLGATVAVFSILAILEVWKWRPGFAQTDETEALMYLQQWREGVPLEVELFKGTLQRHLAAWLLGLTGPSMLALRALTWSSIALEAWLLGRLGQALLGRRSALWAVIACLACATTFLRARSLLSFAFMPAELLVAVIALTRIQSRVGSLLFGAACALMLADYEGWLLALPVLALLWFSQEGLERRWSGWALFGFLLALAALLLPSRDIFAEHVLQRQRNMPGLRAELAANLWNAARGFFAGVPQTTGHLGVRDHSMLAAWSLPFFIVGAWRVRRRGWILLCWAGIGLLPLLSHGGPGEPNRIVAAWPALFLLAGHGAAFFFEKMGRWQIPAAVVILLGGAAWEAKAYQASMALVEPAEYAPSQAVLRLAEARPEALPLLEFNYKSSAPWRFFWDEQRAIRREGEIFVLNWELLPVLSGEKTDRDPNPSLGIYYFTRASAALKQRLRDSDRYLRELHNRLPRYQKRARRDALMAALSRKRDPIVLSAVLQEALKLSSELGELPQQLVALAFKAPLASASAPLWLSDLAARSGDAASARLLCQRAKIIDPRCGCQP